MLKKMFKVFLSCTIIFTCLGLSASADDSDFEKNFDYYYNMCSQRGLTKEQQTTCAAFRRYANQQKEGIEKNIKNLKAKLNTLKANINTQYKEIQKINNQISTVEGKISTVEKSIKTLESNIKAVEKEIKDREDRIDHLNTSIKDRMALNQSNISSNNYIKFVMGATSFADLLRRVSALNEITSYDVSKIEEMEAEKEQLQLDKNELEEHKATLEEEKASLKAYKSSLDSLKKAAEELVAAYRASSAAVGASLADQKADLSELSKQIENIDKVLDGFYPSEGWVSPLRTTFRVTSAFPYYEPGKPSSGFHPASDLGVNLGSKLYAVGNGYVVKTHTGCGYGYIGSTCGGGFGNYVCYLIQVKDTVYLIINAHLSRVNVKVGDKLTQGTSIIGLTGSSGSSSGPHLHIETIKMGKMDIKTAVKKYLRVGGVYYTLGRSVGYCCQYRSAPCYDNPLKIFGFKYGHKYTY